MRIGFVQFTPVFGDRTKNIKKVDALIGQTNADLLVLPELFNTGYIFSSFDELYSLSEKIPEGKTVEALYKIACRRSVFLVAGLAEKKERCAYNTAVLIGPTGYVGKYRKAHLFWYEKLLFTPGDTEFPVYDIGIAKLGIMICFDWIFPEVTRILALKGAQIICHPSNLVFPYCQDAMITRCIENRVFAITSNRTGDESKDNIQLRFTGRSQIIAPDGKILVRAQENSQEIQVVEIEPTSADYKNITPQNSIFEDRRIELYQKLLQ